MAQELLKVKTQLKSGPQIVCLELHQIDDQIGILGEESHKVQERFTSHVAKPLGATDHRQPRHEAVISQLHKTVQGTGVQSMHWDHQLDQEIVRLKAQTSENLLNMK